MFHIEMLYIDSESRNRDCHRKGSRTDLRGVSRENRGSTEGVRVEHQGREHHGSIQREHQGTLHFQNSCVSQLTI